jgi:hypothetical protein
LAVLVAACGSDPVHVAGDYTLALTDRDNGCHLSSWTVGQQTTGIPMTITQSMEQVTANVGGIAQVALDLGLGDHVFTGTVSSSSLDANITGTVPQQTGNCTYTYNAEIYGTLSGNALAGFVHYTAATNENHDCTAVENCVSTQEFSGSRPPP